MNAFSFFHNPRRSPSLPQTARRDPLNRLLVQLTGLAGESSSVVEASSRPWSSATFIGAQHRLALLLPSAQATEHFATTLPDAEFRIPGHIVADAVLDERILHEQAGADHWLCRLTVLTIEDY